MKIHPSEEEIRGAWIRDGTRARGDANTHRIKELVASHLLQIARDSTGWDTLYVDPEDRRFWEHIYPQSEMHGGGPPMLRHLSDEEVRAKYGEQALATARRS
jgi:hypothetical protein